MQSPSNSQSYNRYSYCINNPLKYTDPDGQWFGIDDAIAAGLGFIVGYVTYGATTGNWGWKAVAAGGVGAAVAWVGWNTMGAGTAALTHGAGSATSFSSGMTAVFGSAGGNYGFQFAALTYMNASMHKDQLKAADKKGWNGVWAFGIYSASAVLSTSLKPFSLSEKAGGFGLRQWAGVVLTDNISDNMENGEFNFHSVHVGPVGWDYNRQKNNHSHGWGGFYTIASPGLNSGQRFDMAFESILGLSLIKTNINITYRDFKQSCGVNFFGPMQRLTINTAKIGYYARRGLDLWNQYELFMDNHTVYQHWWNLHYNDDDTANY